MVIDFHTHIFPEKIAARAVAQLASAGNLPPHYDGTEAALISKMQATEIDVSITLPVLTAPRQFESVLEFCEGVNRRYAAADGARLISFAGIHPACENLGEKMRLIYERGFHGVKIHPDFQDTFINDDSYAEILKYAEEYDLAVVTHAGIDASYRQREPRCSPDRVIDLISRAPHTKFVLAHYGGNEMTDEVFDKLCGLDIYFDTGLVLDYIDEKSFKKILDKHGEDRVLFATDGPWGDAEKYLKTLRALGLSRVAEEKILHENAERLINLQVKK